MIGVFEWINNRYTEVHRGGTEFHRGREIFLSVPLCAFSVYSVELKNMELYISL